MPNKKVPEEQLSVLLAFYLKPEEAERLMVLAKSDNRSLAYIVRTTLKNSGVL